MPKIAAIGMDTFEELIDPAKNRLYVDKTLFIKEWIDRDEKVILVVRPRRWGKTMTLSMVQYFFAPEMMGKPTKGMFDHLKIGQVDHGNYLKHQGKHPVIFITFKEIKESTWEGFSRVIKLVIKKLYTEHFPILNSSPKLSDYEKQKLLAFLTFTFELEEYQDALRLLSELLYTHYQQKVIILIDEYDNPINFVYEFDKTPNKEVFERVTLFFKVFFGISLKGNQYMERGMMTGILRLSKNQMLSDINNMRLYSMASEFYAEHFGFLEEEVKWLIQESDVNVDFQEIQKWYNGYRVGKTTSIYNPWSILSCLSERGNLKPYWIQTAGGGILRQSFQRMNGVIENSMADLLAGKTVRSTIDEHLSFDEVATTNPNILWSLLWTTGYLTFSEEPQYNFGGELEGCLKIPNEEVLSSYISTFPKWVRTFDRVHYDTFLKGLISGDLDVFKQSLKEYLLTTPSYFDFTSESHYHAFMLGLMASLKDTHHVISNKEFGYGRPDIVVVPKKTTRNLGLILEFKYAQKGQSVDFYAQLAKEALNQIDLQEYVSAFRVHAHVKRVLKLTLVFWGKEFVCEARFENLPEE